MLMLLKLNSKIKYYLYTLFLLITLNCIFINYVVAYDEFNNAWHAHGFVAQGLIQAEKSSYVNDDGDVSGKLTEIGLNASYLFTPDIRVTGQVVYLNGGNRYSKGARIDYALIDWSVYNDQNWMINLYLGRYKNNHWLYSSTRDVPHTRPSIILPQSMYYDGFRDIAMGSDGAALKVSYGSEEHGDFDFNFSYGTSSLSSDEVKFLLGDMALGEGKQKFDAQMSLYWQPLYSQWRFGLSVLDSDFNYSRKQNEFFSDGLFSFQQYSLSMLFEGERWEFSSELFQQKFLLEGFYAPTFHNESFSQGAYIQTRYQYNDKLRFLARIEKFYGNKEDKNGSQLEKLTGVPHYFAFHNDLTLGASYNLNERLRLQIEFHQVEGTSRLTPITFPNTEINDSEHWNIWALQLMYWF